MATQLNTTDLDFDKIKDNLKTYLKNSGGAFADYDYEGSGLNSLLDILAYNTHYNAVNAHMAVNESFIDTAQVRANVVSHAKLIGYIPRSVRAPSANIALKLKRSSGTDTSATLSSGTTFETTVGGVTYTYQTLADISSSQYNSTTGNFEFDSIDIYEGTSRTSQFFFNDNNNQKFVIRDALLDTSTLKITVKDSAAATSSTTYNLYNSEVDVGKTTAVYFLTENYEGYYQFEFGDNIVGKQPVVGSVITASYLSSNYTASNGAASFTFTGAFPTNTALADSGAITVSSVSSGGAARESTESIQINAPRKFITQDRAVTTQDYESVVKTIIGDLQDVSVYGGQTLSPPQYGKVFISVKPQSSLFLTDAQKSSILTALERKRVITVVPEIIDPDYTYLNFNVYFKYDTSLTDRNSDQIKAAVLDKITTFNTTFLEKFGNNFRYSKFLADIDSTDTAIKGSLAQIYAYKKITFDNASTAGISVSFGFPLLGDIQQTNPIMTSTGWEFNSKLYFLEDVAISGDDTKRRIQKYYIDTNSTKVVEEREVGFLYPNTGVITLDNQQVQAPSADVELKVIPKSYDIPGIENKILTIDTSKTNIFPDANLSTAGGDIVPSTVYNVQPTTTTASFNPFTTAGTFVPHTMYDPVTGIGYSANTHEQHLLYQELGYTHTPPATSTGTTASGSSFGTGATVDTGTTATSSTTSTSTSTSTSSAPSYSGY
tara:strand:+ start:1027 stop:3177 length:2151 start_codon:yes stop_codon:yes gene_type:complete